MYTTFRQHTPCGETASVGLPGGAVGLWDCGSVGLPGGAVALWSVLARDGLARVQDAAAGVAVPTRGKGELG